MKYFSNDKRRILFLGHLQVWATHFQRLMMLKTGLCDDQAFLQIFKQHFQEEIGHDDLLKKDRENKTNIKNGSKPKKDAVLEALCCWFPSKIMSYSLPEQVVMVNLVLESGANIFYEATKSAIDPENKYDYFAAHKEVDCEHEKMGIEHLAELPERQVTRLLEVLEDSWAMTNALLQRIGELVVAADPK